MQRTVVTPKAKVDPEEGLQDKTGLGSQASEAEKENVTISPTGLVHSKTILLEQVTDGGMVSSNVTVKEQELVLPLASCAEQRTVVVPRAKVEPDAGTHVAVKVPLQASETDVAKVTACPLGFVHSTTILVEQVTTGAVVSWMVMVNEHVLVF